MSGADRTELDSLTHQLREVTRRLHALGNGVVLDSLYRGLVRSAGGQLTNTLDTLTLARAEIQDA